MAVESLVAYGDGRQVSADQAIAQDEFHTIIPIIKGHRGVVLVELKLSDDTYMPVQRFMTNPGKVKKWQLRGPLEYRVTTLNAGADVDTGTA